MKNTRRLVYVPILDARGALEQKASKLHENRKNDLILGETDKELSAVGKMWGGISSKIGELNLPYKVVRIYQDGLPVCGNELELVTQLAESGNPNFLYILNLIQKGAKLEGTENLGLLIQEYDLLNKLLLKNSEKDRKEKVTEYQAKSRELLTLRDEFIFNRIHETLQKGELPIVFMSAMHGLDKLLETNFMVSYVIYRLPFQKIGTNNNA